VDLTPGSNHKQSLVTTIVHFFAISLQLVAEGRLKVGTMPVGIGDIGKLWEMEVRDGKRVVVEI
jgi:hypothetical protein